MNLFKLLVVSAIILFISSHVNAAVTDAYTSNDGGSVTDLVLVE